MTEPRTIATTYDGDGSALFGLALKTGGLTIVTLGIYRFWAKTRIRNYVWSKIGLDGDHLEYTGTGLEKLLGFLVAVVVLAVYLAIVQLIFFAIGMRFVINPRTPAEILGQLLLIYGTFFAVLPLMYFASYRSRRYRLARTRFRGIRFGMSSEAWGFTGWAVVYLILTIVTLGIMHPYGRYHLEKYMTDRTWYGDAKLVQGGRWTGLYASMKHLAIGFGILLLSGVLMAAKLPILGVVGVIAGYGWMIVGLVSYGVQGTAYLTQTKTLERAAGEPVVGFQANPSTAEVVKLYLLGGLGVGAAAGAAGAAAGGLLVKLGEAAHTAGMSPVVLIAIGALGYMAFLVLIGALQLVLIQQPIMAHVIARTWVVNADALALVRQRVGEAGADADGFAEALDVGGAF